ncbi:rho guanine nucleotide exchange factor 18 isoform X4 [Culicoides brevitarsis]|uniref:rho guanine nucleotide exchange factor 18 isoform X4 n=1 Tax=Culicoides brevitarsis TaxID=469753 RepID=UPI00307C1F06
MEELDIRDRLLSEGTDDESDGDIVTDFLDIDHPPTPTSTVVIGINSSNVSNNPFLVDPATIPVVVTNHSSGNNNNNSSIFLTNNNNHHHHHHNSQIPNSVNNNSILVLNQNNNSNNNMNNNNTNNASNGGSVVNNGGASTIGNNMVPIISVTPHSPGAKYNCILEDTLNQLQCIRESVVQMKNSSPKSANTLGLVQTSKIFTSCPALNELNENAGFWPVGNSIYSGIKHDRRKSWTAVEDLSEAVKNANANNNSHKSISLSSLDSEEQESLRIAERVHNRSSRNSTGGISTHSLNEAELQRDIERLVAKRSLAPAIRQVPLQKSISTPSIAPIRQNAKEENVSSEFTATDLPEKRRKRGSLFFRKKKDKNKNKGNATNCDSCGAIINLATYKEHAVECKAKLVKSQSSKFGGSKKNTSTSHHPQHDDSRDTYDGHMPNEHSNYTEDAPLLREEFLNEAPVGVHELGAEPVLGISLDEPDSWSPSVPREVVKSLKDKQIKRQEHIYEFIMTEKHHCQTLLVMQKVFVESLQRHFSHLNLERMFPRLQELMEIHTGFLKKLRLKQKERHVVDTIADILLDFFSSMSAQRLKSVYGEFCSNHRSALNVFKCYLTEDGSFADWYKHCQQNPLLKKKGIPECILFVTQRLTKYPLLIDPLLKSSREDKIEQEKLQKAMSLVKEILVEVDARVADKEKEDRQLEIFKRIDAKSYAVYKKEKFKKSDIISSNRKLKFEGVATLMQGRSKMQTVMVVVLSDCLFFLQESNQKYTFFTPENKAGVVSLQKLLIREKAGTESRGIYIISSNPAYPEMFELKVQSPKDKNVWIQSIRNAVVDCPSFEFELEDQLSAEERQKLLEQKHQTMREIITASGTSELEGKMRIKDFEQAILLEEKIALQLNLLLEHRANSGNTATPINVDTLLESFGTYRDLVTDDCDTVEIWRRVLTTIHDVQMLASSLYTAATGLQFARSFSSVGERQSELYVSPTLPKRAETFGGFDERRSRLSRDAVLTNISSNPYQTLVARSDHDSALDSYSLSSTRTSNDTINQEMIKDQNYAALQVSHHLQTLLCIISQQMTTIGSLQTQLTTYRENPKSIYRHNDQLEELRNLQDKLTEEKAEWLKQREEQQRELDEQRLQQKQLQEHLRKDQEDIKEQREQLYRKMELLSNQGLLISPNTQLPVQSNANITQTDDSQHGHDESHTDSAASHVMDRRKEKWRSASVPKTPPVNLISATNAPKVTPGQIPKQTIPLKLSSSSSTKSNSSGSASSILSPISAVSQMLPYKLADNKKGSSSNQPTIIPHHSRTGSSPAVIQQPAPPLNPATRTNTYPKLPERYRLRSSDGYPTSSSNMPNAHAHEKRSASVVGQLPVDIRQITEHNTAANAATTTTVTVNKGANVTATNNKQPPTSEEEEVIFF